MRRLVPGPRRGRRAGRTPCGSSSTSAPRTITLRVPWSMTRSPWSSVVVGVAQPRRRTARIRASSSAKEYGLASTSSAPRFSRRDPVALGGAAGADDDRNRAAAPDGGQHVGRAAAEVEVEDDEIGGVREDRLERLVHAGRLRDLVTGSLQVVLEGPAGVVVVLGDEDRLVGQHVADRGEHRRRVRIRRRGGPRRRVCPVLRHPWERSCDTALRRDRTGLGVAGWRAAGVPDVERACLPAPPCPSPLSSLPQSRAGRFIVCSAEPKCSPQPPVPSSCPQCRQMSATGSIGLLDQRIGRP